LSRKPVQVFVYTPAEARAVIGKDQFSVLIPQKPAVLGGFPTPELRELDALPKPLENLLLEYRKFFPPIGENAVKTAAYDSCRFEAK